MECGQGDVWRAQEHWRDKWEVSWEQTGRALEVGTGPGKVARAGQGQGQREEQLRDVGGRSQLCLGVGWCTGTGYGV